MNRVHAQSRVSSAGGATDGGDSVEIKEPGRRGTRPSAAVSDLWESTTALAGKGRQEEKEDISIGVTGPGGAGSCLDIERSRYDGREGAATGCSLFSDDIDQVMHSTWYTVVMALLLPPLYSEIQSFCIHSRQWPSGPWPLSPFPPY